MLIVVPLPIIPHSFWLQLHQCWNHLSPFPILQTYNGQVCEVKRPGLGFRGSLLEWGRCSDSEGSHEYDTDLSEKWYLHISFHFISRNECKSKQTENRWQVAGAPQASTSVESTESRNTEQEQLHGRIGYYQTATEEFLLQGKRLWLSL